MVCPGEAGVTAQQRAQKPTILFTAFEPSGDVHAAPVIRELRASAPGLRVCAAGGPRMEAAGAEMLHRTVQIGAMGLEAVRHSLTVRRVIKDLKGWAREQRLVAHVPVDSPAANFPLAGPLRKAGVKIIHLVAPQIWAWGWWRIGKLRRRTDLVLCLLPFEEPWFRERGVPARFIGHPSINRKLDVEAMRERMHGLPVGAPRVAIFPGSREHEVFFNDTATTEIYTELQGRHAGMRGVIVATNPHLAKLIRKKLDVFPTGLHMITGDAEAVIGWCDLALAVSGTISLDITLQRRPMIGLYRTSWISWLGAKLVLHTPYRLLPNIVAEREIVPEFIPYIGGPMPIVHVATRFLSDSKHAAVQAEELHRVCLRFANHDPPKEAARLILETINPD
jgi:lipid-A-disaccharide synthase